MMSYGDDAMPCGDCVVCGEYLDHRDLGTCKKCGEGFHWNRCGGWSDDGDYHICGICKSEANFEEGAG